LGFKNAFVWISLIEVRSSAGLFVAILQR